MDTRLLIDGLPSVFTDQQLEELFSRFGIVQSAKVTRDSRGQSLRFGYVKMATLHEAHKAVQQLNRSKFDGQVLVVKIENNGPGWFPSGI